MFHGARLVLSSDESPSSIASEMGRAQVFHFSGHAFSDVQSAGLVTGGGELVDALRLPESVPLRSQLVVLSACDTARGSNGNFDDEDSLVRRLMEAGVPEVVASRWMVDSPATLALMKNFYRHLLSGKSVSAALALASRDLRSRPEYSHPFYWAGFSVFGRG
jgi:CHAT domain-containing protein